MSNENKVIELLKNEALINPTFNAVCHVFAVRQRTRYKVTVSTLMAAMKSEGFNFSKEQYIGVLKFLNTLGLGQLTVDSKKRVRSLDHIKVTLQSIGKTALGQGEKVKRQTPTHRYTQLIGSAIPADPKRETPIKRAKPVTAARKVTYPVFVTAVIDGRMVSFPLREVTPEDLGDLLVSAKKLGQEPSA